VCVCVCVLFQRAELDIYLKNLKNERAES